MNDEKLVGIIIAICFDLQICKVNSFRIIIFRIFTAENRCDAGWSYANAVKVSAGIGKVGKGK